MDPHLQLFFLGILPNLQSIFKRTPLTSSLYLNSPIYMYIISLNVIVISLLSLLSKMVDPAVMFLSWRFGNKCISIATENALGNNEDNTQTINTAGFSLQVLLCFESGSPGMGSVPKIKNQEKVYSSHLFQTIKIPE